MRKIKYIVLHCSATKEGVPFGIEDIDRWHRQRGFRKVGYHYVIEIDGTIRKGRDIAQVGAHVQGSNANSIGICYIVSIRFTTYFLEVFENIWDKIWRN